MSFCEKHSIPHPKTTLLSEDTLQEIEDEGDTYESIEDIWPDYPTNDDDFFFDPEEY